MSGMVVNVTHILPQEFLNDSKSLIAERITSTINRFSTIKVNTEFYAEFIKHDDTADIKSFNTKTCALDVTTCFDEWYETHVYEPILRKLEEFQERDSGWALSRIENICININKYTPMSAGCYIETPTYIKKKKAVINIKSHDCACFAWSVVAHLYPAKNNPCRVNNYPFYKSVLNVEHIRFPTPLKEISRFEEDNNISVNVFTYVENENQKKCIAPIRLTQRIRDQHVNLLYLKNEHHAHYMYIRSLSRLVSAELSTHEHKKYICNRCLNYFTSEEVLHTHKTICANFNEIRIVLPDESKEAEKWMTFKNHKNKEPVPIVVYADLECLLISNSNDKDDNENEERILELEEEEEEDDDNNEVKTDIEKDDKVHTDITAREEKRKKLQTYQSHVP